MSPSTITRLPSRQLQRMFNMLQALAPLSKDVVQPLLAWAPTLAKYTVYLLFLVNMKSWPLVWHFRVFRPVFVLRYQYHLLHLKTFFRSQRVRELEEDKWADSIAPVGANPFTFCTTFHTRATIDESDFNGHLSNSSYPKALDAGRFKAALEMIPHFFRAGGWIALAGTHFSFIREIPMLSRYEVRMSLAGWDHKWLYVIARFATKKKRSSKDAQDKNTLKNPNTLIVTTPTTDANSVTITPETAPTPSGSEPDNTSNTLDAVVAELLSEMEEEDDVVLHTVAVSQLCFKVGRITVPPAVVLASNGYSVPPTSGLKYSHENPPPHWSTAKDLMSKPQGGSMKKLHNFYKSGWKDAPEGQRWWQDALGGVTEERRRRNMIVFDPLRKSMLGAKAV